jgi:hypothetical protein
MSAEEDQAATQLVRQVLALGGINEIKFSLGPDAIDVSPAMYSDVLNAIGAPSKIKVTVEPSMLKPDEGGRYYAEIKLPNGDMWYDVLVLRYADLGSGANEQFNRAAKIVHECTHAGFAIRRVPNMTHLLHEAGAYAADAIFQIGMMVGMKGHPEKVNTTSMDAIHGAAWNLAFILYESNHGRNVPLATAAAVTAGGPPLGVFAMPIGAVVAAAQLFQAWNNLYAAIANSNEYRAVANDPVNNAGLGRHWIITGREQP